MRVFNPIEGVQIVCERKKTRVAFKHEATLVIHGCTEDKAKVCYENRTWESYEFQSVMQKLVSKTKALSPEQRAAVEKFLEEGPKDKPFAAIATVAMMGNLLYDTQEATNAWKARMLKAGIPELSLPDNWAELSESEKASRLDKVINQLSKE